MIKPPLAKLKDHDLGHPLELIAHTLFVMKRFQWLPVSTRKMAACLLLIHRLRKWVWKIPPLTAVLLQTFDMVVKKKTPKVEAVVLDDAKLERLQSELTY